MSRSLIVPVEAARRFLLTAFALDGFQTLPDVPTAVNRLEFVQEDSINVCGRIHDLILWNRVKAYRPQLLHRTLYRKPREAFEYYFPNLSVLPLDDYRYFLRRMQNRANAGPSRWHGLEPHEEPAAERVLLHIDKHGPLRTRATGAEEGHTTSGWGTKTSIAAHVVEKLWLHGRLTVAKRENFERWFDRTERLLPNVAELELPDETEERIFLTRKRLRAKRLFRPKKDDIALLGKEAFIAVEIDGIRRPWYILAEDEDALTNALRPPLPLPVAHFLAPLDPLVYDRDRNLDLWNFEYTWEVYTPAARRRWGYYVLPIAYGDRIVGRIDPKIDRRTGTLTILSLRLEPGVREAQVGPAIVTRLKKYARFLDATQIVWENVESERLRARLEKAFG